MNNVFLLTKATFLSGFNTNKKKGNQKSSFRTLIIVSVFLTIMSFFYNYMFITEIRNTETGFEDYVVIVSMVASLFTFMTSVFQMQSAIFKTRDYEFLESLPIKKTSIVLSKILSVYLMNLIEDIIIAGPAYIYYIIFTGNVVNLLILLIALPFISLIPLLISSLFASLVAFISSLFKRKAIVSFIVYILLFAGIYLVSFSFSSGQVSGMDFRSIMVKVPYFLFLRNALDASRRYEIILFLLVNIVSFVLIGLFIGFVYKPINVFIQRGESKKEYKAKKEKESKNSSLNKLLFKKEQKMLLGKSGYLVNACTGPIVFLLSGLVMTIGQKLFLSDMSDEDFVMTIMMIFSILPGLGIFFMSLMSPAPASFSLEGKNFDLLLSYPIDEWSLIRAKLLMSITSLSVISFISSAILSVISVVMIGLNPLLVVNLFLLPLSMIIITSLIGIMCGMRWAKFEFDSEQVVLKNSACSNLSMLFSVIIALPLGGAAVAFGIISTSDPIFNLVLWYIILYVVIIIIITILFIILKKRGLKLFKHMVLNR